MLKLVECWKKGFWTGRLEIKEQQQQLTALRRNFIYNQRAHGRLEIFMSSSSHRQTVLLRVESKTHTREIFIQIQIYNQFNRARRAASRITSPHFIIRNSQGRFHWAFCIRFVPDAKWGKNKTTGEREMITLRIRSLSGSDVTGFPERPWN